MGKIKRKKKKKNPALLWAGKPAEQPLGQSPEGMKERQEGEGRGGRWVKERTKRTLRPDGWCPRRCTSELRFKPYRHVPHFDSSWGGPGRRYGDSSPICPMR